MTPSIHDVLVTYKTIESVAKHKSKNLFDHMVKPIYVSVIRT
jgi:hypothetical protein